MGKDGYVGPFKNGVGTVSISLYDLLKSEANKPCLAHRPLQLSHLLHHSPLRPAVDERRGTP